MEPIADDVAAGTIIESGCCKDAMMMVVLGEQYCSEEERELTVQKTGLFYLGDGFAAYNHRTGELVFRVDTYALDHQLVLMDPSGKPILTVRRKWPTLHQRWDGYVGDKTEGQKPLFSVRRSSIFGNDRTEGSVAVELYRTATTTIPGNQYRVEGCFGQRCCRIVSERDGDGEVRDQEVVLAEIKRKVDGGSPNPVTSKDVFCLCLKPGVDAAFAMGLVLVLDQIAGEDGQYYDINEDDDAAPSNESHHSNHDIN